MLMFFATLFPGALPAPLKNLLTAGGVSLKDRGDFLAFLIGVPLAASASVIGALIAQSTREVARSQKQIQAAAFFDAKLTAGNKSFVALINAFDALVDLSDELAHRFEEFDERCHACGADHLAVLVQSETPPPLDRFLPLWRQRATAEIREIGKQADIIITNFIELAVDPFWAKAFAQQASIDTDWNAPIKSIVTGREFTPLDLARITRRITRRLDVASERGEALYLGYVVYGVVRNMAYFRGDFVGALLELGTSEEGGALRPHQIEDWRAAGREETRLIQNTGAAALISMFNSVPEPAAILKAAAEMYPELQLKDSSVNTSLPDKSKVVDAGFVDVAARLTSAPGGLTAALLFGGGDIKAPPAKPATTKTLASFPRKRNTAQPMRRSARAPIAQVYKASISTVS